MIVRIPFSGCGDENKEKETPLILIAERTNDFDNGRAEEDMKRLASMLMAHMTRSGVLAFAKQIQYLVDEVEKDGGRNLGRLLNEDIKALEQKYGVNNHVDDEA